MCQLKHPNVVTCFGVTTSNNYFNLFLELMTGRFELLRCAWRFSCLKEVAIEVLQKKNVLNFILKSTEEFVKQLRVK